MAATPLVYDLGTLISDDLSDTADAIAEALERSEESVAEAINRNAARYRQGRLTQGTYWETIADELGLEETDLLATHALNAAVVDRELLGRVRAQAPAHRLGLLSDATPDWVGHWRQTLELDKLFHSSVIGSDFDEARSYRDLLTISAERLQAAPGETYFVDRAAAHLETAAAAGMRTINLSQSHGYREAFAVLSH